MSLAEKLTEFNGNWVQATKESFSNHWLANFFRNDVKKDIETIVRYFDNTYQVKASAGAGNWANVPWLSILNPKITTTTQDGIYPVYLFCADGSGFYLSLNQGTTEPKNKFGKVEANIRSELIKDYILAKFPELSSWGKRKIDLSANTVLGKSYENANIIAKYYSLDTKLNSQKLEVDLLELLTFYQQMETLDIDAELQQFALIKPTKNVEPLKNIKTSLPKNTTPLSKPFLLLAGISGTGKTRFVREQAKATGSINENYRLTPVRPDWHEPSDILGYISRLNGVEYVTTEVLQFIARAWRAIIDARLDLDDDNTESKLIVTGDKALLDTVLPYWLCLDEMNLAPVEQYFADYLSILETREWHWDDDQFEYCCDALLSAATIQQLDTTSQNNLQGTLGFIDKDDDKKYDKEWALFCKHGLSIPFNLIVAGTVNMDETTHGFSRKVIDRALSFDFGEFFPNDFDHFFTPIVKMNALSYPIHSHANSQYLPAFDSDGTKSIHFLNAVNTVLNDTPFKLAFRALNELLLTVMSTEPTDEGELQAVWDDFLMHKVLPRIEGDYDKLALINKATSSSEQSLLTELAKVLEQELADIWPTTNDTNKRRPDLYRKNEDDSTLYITCRSKAKLAWMQQRLERSGFTSFWP